MGGCNRSWERRGAPGEAVGASAPGNRAPARAWGSPRPSGNHAPQLRERGANGGDADRREHPLEQRGGEWILGWRGHDIPRVDHRPRRPRTIDPTDLARPARLDEPAPATTTTGLRFATASDGAARPWRPEQSCRRESDGVDGSPAPGAQRGRRPPVGRSARGQRACRPCDSRWEWRPVLHLVDGGPRRQHRRGWPAGTGSLGRPEGRGCDGLVRNRGAVAGLPPPGDGGSRQQRWPGWPSARWGLVTVPLPFHLRRLRLRPCERWRGSRNVARRGFRRSWRLVGCWSSSVSLGWTPLVRAPGQGDPACFT